MAITPEWVEQADALTPKLIENVVYPKQFVQVVADDESFQGWRMVPAGDIKDFVEKVYDKGDSFVLDFEDHLVGYLTMSIRWIGSPQDAPLRLKLTFGEMPCEIGENFDDYKGWLSRSWLQEEIVYVDVLPGTVKLPRRYCFRYLKVEVLNTSVKYKITFTDIHCTTVTSGDKASITPLPSHIGEELAELDRVGIKTLQDCMQTVFEDGPKRDRRLWIGDLRLQAQANYLTFRNYDLVKRCLYLFGGMTLDGGEVGACLFEKPVPLVDDTLLYDYALFFVSTLYDYYHASGDRQTLTELWPVAMEQLRIGLARLDERGIVKDDPSWWCFTDWHPDLNKQAPAQAVLIYALKQGAALARELRVDEERQFIEERTALVIQAARDHLWDDKQGFFVSGETCQVSWAAQVWMVLAGVLETEENIKLLNRLFERNPEIGMTTPYMYHHLVEALFTVGMKERALEEIKAYWGGMLADGADTFWELYNPQDKRISPYGSNLINSYCHAWSCTPSYFIRKYLI